MYEFDSHETITFAVQSGTISVNLAWSAGPYKRKRKFPVDLSVVAFTKSGALEGAVNQEEKKALGGSLKHSRLRNRSKTATAAQSTAATPQRPLTPANAEENASILPEVTTEAVTTAAAAVEVNDPRTDADITASINLDSLSADVSVLFFAAFAVDGGTLDNCNELTLSAVNNSDGKLLHTIQCSNDDLEDTKGIIIGALYKQYHTNVWFLDTYKETAPCRHYTGCMPTLHGITELLIDPNVSTGGTALQMDKTIEMRKGDQLTIPNTVTKLVAGLGWETVTEGLDLDASCVLLYDLDNDGDLDPVDAVYFMQKQKPGIRSTGDNQTGAGDGDDEQIFIDLERVDVRISSIAVVVTIYAEGRTFKEVTDAYVRIADQETGHEFCRYSLGSSLTKSALVFCMLNRGSEKGDPWTLVSIGEQCKGNRVTNLETKLWDGVWNGEGRRTENILRLPEVFVPQSTAFQQQQQQKEGQKGPGTAGTVSQANNKLTPSRPTTAATHTRKSSVHHHRHSVLRRSINSQQQ